MQQIALGWLVYDLTRRASLLGTVSFCGNAPILVLGLVGGAIAPALAGFAYGTIGPQGCFALNATGFLVMILMLARVRLPRRPPGAPPPVGRALREGLGYARRHPVIAPSLVLVAVMSVFG